MLEALTIPRVHVGMRDEIQHAIDTKTKPPGSLGRIESLAMQMALVQGTLTPRADPGHLMIFAGDHGIVEEGVSAWPQDVTAQMVLNFLGGGAAANVFADSNGIGLSVLDAGVAGDLPDLPSLKKAAIRRGTRNAAREDALTPEETARALMFGADAAAEIVSEGARVVAIGEMGIGNTSAASLVAAAIDGIDIDELVGPGAGLDDDGLARKREVLRRTLARRTGTLAPVDALSAFGGLEISAMAGAAIAAAANRALVLVDGFIASAAALAALRARPEVEPYLVFAHRSKEPGHRLILESARADPLLDLDLRLGEGTGALLAFPMLRAACAMLCRMATFETAGVSGRE